MDIFTKCYLNDIIYEDDPSVAMLSTQYSQYAQLNKPITLKDGQDIKTGKTDGLHFKRLYQNKKDLQLFLYFDSGTTWKTIKLNKDNKVDLSIIFSCFVKKQEKIEKVNVSDLKDISSYITFEKQLADCQPNILYKIEFKKKDQTIYYYCNKNLYKEDIIKQILEKSKQSAQIITLDNKILEKYVIEEPESQKKLILDQFKKITDNKELLQTKLLNLAKTLEQSKMDKDSDVLKALKVGQIAYNKQSTFVISFKQTKQFDLFYEAPTQIIMRYENNSYLVISAQRPLLYKVKQLRKKEGAVTIKKLSDVNLDDLDLKKAVDDATAKKYMKLPGMQQVVAGLKLRDEKQRNSFFAFFEDLFASIFGIKTEKYEKYTASQLMGFSPWVNKLVRKNILKPGNYEFEYKG